MNENIYDTKVQVLKCKVLKEVSKLAWSNELLEKVLEIKNFYNKCPTNSDNAIVVFENIILLIKKFKIQNDLAIKHLEFVVKYAKSKENSEALLKKIEHIVTNNIGHFANSVEEMAFVQFKIR